MAQREQRSAPACTGRRSPQVVPGQSIDGGQVVGVQSVLAAKHKYQGEQGNPVVGQVHDWQLSSGSKCESRCCPSGDLALLGRNGPALGTTAWRSHVQGKSGTGCRPGNMVDGISSW